VKPWTLDPMTNTLIIRPPRATSNALPALQHHTWHRTGDIIITYAFRFQQRRSTTLVRGRSNLVRAAVFCEFLIKPNLQNSRKIQTDMHLSTSLPLLLKKYSKKIILEICLASLSIYVALCFMPKSCGRNKRQEFITYSNKQAPCW
jgi:hypothetical protein